jgi:hypothetical protein
MSRRRYVDYIDEKRVKFGCDGQYRGEQEEIMRRVVTVIILLLTLISNIISCTPASDKEPTPEPRHEPIPIPAPTISVTYKVEFIADWSEKTHPNDYPSGAHFSPFVAYSHNDSVDSQIFDKGQKATPGIEQMAETGNTNTLNQEIDKLISSNLAFKKTRGKLFNSPGIDSSELEFTRDYGHITFVSMIAPSPDWFVSQTTNLLKAEEWIDEIELALITYDAGSDSGRSLTAQDIDTQPKEPISVFSDNLQRLGKLILTRIR